MVLIKVKEGPVRGPSFVPVYTLHEMTEEIRKPMRTIRCGGCGHDIPAPRGSAHFQCRDCGRKMHIVSIRPANQATQAG